MNLNVILQLDYKTKFTIQSIALNTNKRNGKAVPFEFAYLDRDAADHPDLLPKNVLGKLKRKAQAVYRTLSGDAVTDYYDLAIQMFRYRGILLAPVPGESTGNERRYDLLSHPEDFIKALESPAFAKLPAAEQAQELYRLIPEEDQVHFRDALHFGYHQIRKEFIELYTEEYMKKAHNVFFSVFDESNESLAQFVADKSWYFTQYKDLGFAQFYQLLSENYLEPLQSQFFRNYEVSDFKTLKAAASLYDTLHQTEVLRESAKKMQLEKQVINEEASDEFVTPQRVSVANNKYLAVLKQTNTGKLGHSIGPIKRSSPANELLDSSITFNPLGEQSNGPPADLNVEQLDDPMDGKSAPVADSSKSCEIGKFGKNVAFHIDQSGAPLLDASGTIDARNEKRSKAKKIDKNEPVVLKPSSSKKGKSTKKNSPSVNHNKKRELRSSPDLAKKMIKKKGLSDQPINTAEPQDQQTVPPNKPAKKPTDDQAKKSDGPPVGKQPVSDQKKPDGPTLTKPPADDQKKPDGPPLTKQPADDQTKPDGPPLTKQPADDQTKPDGPPLTKQPANDQKKSDGQPPTKQPAGDQKKSDGPPLTKQPAGDQKKSGDPTLTK